MADDRAAAAAVLGALVTAAGGGEVFVDVPSVNRDAVALAQGLRASRRCSRPRACIPGRSGRHKLERVFGVTTFELG